MPNQYCFRAGFRARAVVTLLASCGLSFAWAQPIQMAQEPALSPDGATLAFSWRGDLWLVPVTGGTAQKLTDHSAVDTSPAFSPDGKELAFISERDGSRQVYLMPATGGMPRQVTSHTEGYDIHQWMPDGDTLVVSIARDFTWARESRSARPALLNVRRREAEKVLIGDYAYEVSMSVTGNKVLFTREGESWWRQGYQGSRAGQIWIVNLEDGLYKQVKGGKSESRWPLWSRNDAGFYYVSNRDGVANLYEYAFSTGDDRQVTHFKTDSVVAPTLSRDGGTLVFRHLFDLYSWQPGKGGEPEKIAIECNTDTGDLSEEKRVLDRATGITFTKDGLQMAFLAGGDVWVMDTELREPRQVTRTPEEERDVTFAPDGKSLWFVSDAEGQPDIWKAEPTETRKYWWENTKFTLTRITHDPETESGIQFSADGKYMAWVKGLGDLWISGGDREAHRLFASWNAPDFKFSPDGSWIVYAVSDEWFNRDIWLQSLDRSRPAFNLSRHPDNDESPRWSPDGKLIAWTGRRNGEDVDIHYVWLRTEDDERTRRERTAEKAREKIRKAAAPPSANAGSTSTRQTKGSKSPSAPAPAPKPETPEPAPATPPAPPKPTATSPDKPATDKPAAKTNLPAATAKPKPTPMRIDLDDIHQRIHRIPIANTSEASLVWSPDSKNLAFNATVDGKRGTYTVEVPDDVKPKFLASVTGSDAVWLKNNDQIVCLSEGQPTTLTSKGTVSTHRFRALQKVDRAGRQRAVFDQCWRTMRDRYYDEDLGNRDWNAVRAKYADAAASAPDMRAVAEIVYLMLGELNGSHLGFSLTPPLGPTNVWKEETAHLGLLFDPTFTGPGWKVRHVLNKGPASHRNSRIQTGEVIRQVNGFDVMPNMDASQVLNGPPERDIQLRVAAADGKLRDVTLRPINYINARLLLYREWIAKCRRKVEQTPGVKLGYLHISAMNDESFERFEEDLYAAGAGKEGLVIDVRENGGGSTTDHLLTALTQPRHAITIPRGGTPGYPQDRMVYAVWQKPIVVLCNQNSFSNAEIFSHAIKALKRGKLVGVPTAGGVISTGATSIMDVGTLRLPFRGWYGIESGEDMELNGAQPDFIIWPLPGEADKGIDTQLAKAISVLTDEVNAWRKRPTPKLNKASERKPRVSDS